MGEPYDAYLNSEAWGKIRASRIKLDNGMCQMCGCANNLEVHHISYKERDRCGKDISTDGKITLCRRCHSDVHSFMEDVRSLYWAKTAMLTNNSRKDGDKLTYRADAISGRHMQEFRRQMKEDSALFVLDVYVLARCGEFGGDFPMFKNRRYKDGEYGKEYFSANTYVDGLINYQPESKYEREDAADFLGDALRGIGKRYMAYWSAVNDRRKI